MSKNIESILASFDDSDLSEWSDTRSISRGRGYVNRVHDIVAIKDGGVTAKVDGTHEYLATIYLNDVGKVEMECSCPVEDACKHCVALALKCREMLKAGKKIKTLAEDNPYWRELRSEFGEDMEVFGGDDVPVYEDEKGAIQRIAEMDFSELPPFRGVDDMISTFFISLSPFCCLFYRSNALYTIVRIVYSSTISQCPRVPPTRRKRPAACRDFCALSIVA